jgi:hypothetical protein
LLTAFGYRGDGGHGAAVFNSASPAAIALPSVCGLGSVLDFFPFDGVLRLEVPIVARRSCPITMAMQRSNQYSIKSGPNKSENAVANSEKEQSRAFKLYVWRLEKVITRLCARKS